ncbi:leucine-rich repeat domain-containing protein, partial [Lysinibacillus xylanilyticus]|uniref:leucine-rich repeat domain-containing protein n=1 Tax=Lysinibacillus xylanilyticus TaxID=582475 RepID=UPI0036D77241
ITVISKRATNRPTANITIAYKETPQISVEKVTIRYEEITVHDIYDALCETDEIYTNLETYNGTASWSLKELLESAILAPTIDLTEGLKAEMEDRVRKARDWATNINDSLTEEMLNTKLTTPVKGLHLTGQEAIDAGIAFDATTGTLWKMPTNGETHITVPNSIGGVVVESLKDEIFANCNLESVTLPNTLRVIGSGAFNNNNLKVIKLPTKLEYVNSSFRDNELSSISVPKSVISIGDLCFKGNNLVRVEMLGTTIHKLLPLFGEWTFKDAGENIVIACHKDSEIEKHAISLGFSIEYLEAVTEKKVIGTLSKSNIFGN